MSIEGALYLEGPFWGFTVLLTFCPWRSDDAIISPKADVILHSVLLPAFSLRPLEDDVIKYNLVRSYFKPITIIIMMENITTLKMNHRIRDTCE
jgi:hypothetical protein